MMAPRRVVIVLEAEKLFIPKRESKAADEELQRLEEFLERPPAHTTVVFVCGALDMRRRAVKRLMSKAQVVDCGVIENEADAERWVKVRAARDRDHLDPATPRALVARTGLDIVRLRSGLERVALYAMGQPTITPDDVRQAVPAGPEAQRISGSRTRSSGTMCARRSAKWAVARRRRGPVLHPRPVAARGGTDAGTTGQAGRRSGLPDGSRAQVVGRRPADPARATGGGVVRSRRADRQLAGAV